MNETQKILNYAAKQASVKVSDLRVFKTPPGYFCLLHRGEGEFVYLRKGSGGQKIESTDEFSYADAPTLSLSSRGEASCEWNKKRKRFLRM